MQNTGHFGDALPSHDFLDSAEQRDIGDEFTCARLLMDLDRRSALVRQQQMPIISCAHDNLDGR